MKKSLLLAGLIAMGLGASAQTPFAYGISGERAGEILGVEYALNADAQNVELQLVNVQTKEVVATEPLGGATNGKHEAFISLEGLADGAYTLQIAVYGEALTEPKQVFSDFGTGQAHQFWSPYGIAVDNNPLSPNFGRVLCNESQTSVPASYFAGGKVGLFEYTPAGEFVAYHNPLNIRTDFCPDGTTRAFNFKKIRISKDGRIFVGVDNCVNNPIYELSADLETWTPLFEGTLDAETGYINDAEGNFIAGPSAAFDIAGEGENLKLVNLACKGGQVFAYGNFTTHTYDLGTATSVSTPVGDMDEVIPLSMQYTISAQSVSLAMDQDGKGIWYAQYRGTPTEAQPAIKHVSLNADGEWEEDYSDVTTVVRGGGIAWNKDYTMLAIPKGNNLLGVYEVTEGEAGPVLNEIHSLSLSSIRGFNDIAWDYANNIYACDNGKEVLQMIQLPNVKASNSMVKENEVEPVVTPTDITFEVKATAVKDLNTEVAKTVKYIENGQVVIEKAGVKYNVAGQVIK